MQLTKEELGRLLRWFNAVDAAEPAFMEKIDRELALRIMETIASKNKEN